MPRQGKVLQNNTFNKQKKQILEAIAKYKSQKQRPSQERIIRELQNRYGTTEEEVLEHLKALVRNGDVVRVTDRGQVSFRDASLVMRTVIERTKDFRCFVKEALDNISYDTGATVEEIENYIKDRCGGRNIPQTDLSAQTNAAINKMEASKKVIKEGFLYKLVLEPHSEVCDKLIIKSLIWLLIMKLTVKCIICRLNYISLTERMLFKLVNPNTVLYISASLNGPLRI